MCKNLQAEVVSVLPNKIKILVEDIDDFKISGEKLSVGSYLRISDTEDCAIIAIIENYKIEYDVEKKKDSKRLYIIEALPIGFLDNEKKFIRGGNNIAIPPSSVEPAEKIEIQTIYNQMKDNKRFYFSKLAQDKSIRIPVNGDSFFGKHIAIVGSTGSGKSHTVAKIFQEAIEQKESEYDGLNNSHIVIFDIHSEYKTAFPEANYIDIENLKLPYWLMNGEELEELLVESGENQAYNQISLLRRIITVNKQLNSGNEDNDITFDSPVKFFIQEVLNCIINLSSETRNAKKPSEIKIKSTPKEFDNDENKYKHYFKEVYNFDETKSQSVNKGTYNDSSLEKFISRIRNKTTDKRLKFLFGKKSEEIKFEDVLIQFLGYHKKNNSNITVIDLSGVPFEVLSITVSLISRLLFEYGYYFKKNNVDLKCKTPLLLVYEEAHKYVPKIKESKYNSCRISIERIAKEGRKYGVSLVIVSQRPSEVSETIFSQCNNFISMRLTNTQDQNYVMRLLPDSFEPLINALPILKCGEALLIGDSVIMPSLVCIDVCKADRQPSSNDIAYLQEWKKRWHPVEFNELVNRWFK